MTEESEKMMLLLKELALLKRSESEEPDGAELGLSRSLAADKIKEVTREMKRLARATKNKSRKN